jgi:hypothetical protein
MKLQSPANINAFHSCKQSFGREGDGSARKLLGLAPIVAIGTPLTRWIEGRTRGLQELLAILCHGAISSPWARRRGATWARDRSATRTRDGCGSSVASLGQNGKKIRAVAPCLKAFSRQELTSEKGHATWTVYMESV